MLIHMTCSSNASIMYNSTGHDPPSSTQVVMLYIYRKVLKNYGNKIQVWSEYFLHHPHQKFGPKSKVKYSKLKCIPLGPVSERQI